jgi:hypothetical protein
VPFICVCLFLSPKVGQSHFLDLEAAQAVTKRITKSKADNLSMLFVIL